MYWGQKETKKITNSAKRHHAGEGRSGSNLLALCHGHSSSFSAWFSPNSYIITAIYCIFSCYSSKFQVLVHIMARSCPFSPHVLEIFRFVEISRNKLQFLLDNSMNHRLLAIIVILIFVLVFPSSRSSGPFCQCVFQKQ